MPFVLENSVAFRRSKAKSTGGRCSSSGLVGQARRVAVESRLAEDALARRRPSASAPPTLIRNVLFFDLKPDRTNRGGDLGDRHGSLLRTR